MIIQIKLDVYLNYAIIKYLKSYKSYIAVIILVIKEKDKKFTPPFLFPPQVFVSRICACVCVCVGGGG